jgi:hypothetical protein
MITPTPKNAVIFVGVGLSAIYIFVGSDFPILGSYTRLAVFACCLAAEVLFVASYVIKGQATEEAYSDTGQVVDKQFFKDREQKSAPAPNPQLEVDIKKELEKADLIFKANEKITEKKDRLFDFKRSS